MFNFLHPLATDPANVFTDCSENCSRFAAGLDATYLLGAGR